MFALRSVSTVALLFGCLLANAVPIPMAVNPNHVQAGAVFTAKPAHFDPALPGHSSTEGAARNHPVVALGHPDHEGWVPVAAVSHHQPQHMGTTHDASHYHTHTHAAGTGHFNEGSHIAVEKPTHVHIDNLNHVHPDSNLPHQLHHTDTANLVNAVHQHSGYLSTNPRIHTPPPVTPPWRKHTGY